MFFMSFPIDAVYMDRAMRVVWLERDLQPWAIGKIVHGAASVVELPAGTVARTGTQKGDQIRIA